MERIKNYLRPFLKWKFALCFFIAWFIINGWSYIFILIGSLCDITWMLNSGAGWQAFLWLPGTPEKLVLIPMAMWFNAKFIHDEKTHTDLAEMRKQALADWKKFTGLFKRKKKEQAIATDSNENILIEEIDIDIDKNESIINQPNTEE